MKFKKGDRVRIKKSVLRLNFGSCHAISEAQHKGVVLTVNEADGKTVTILSPANGAKWSFMSHELKAKKTKKVKVREPMKYKFQTKALSMPTLASECTLENPVLKIAITSRVKDKVIVRRLIAVHHTLIDKAAALDLWLKSAVALKEATYTCDNATIFELKEGINMGGMIKWLEDVRCEAWPTPTLDVSVVSAW